MERLLTVKDIADLFGIAEGTIYHWISEGRIPVIRFSKRCVRFRESDVLFLIQQLTARARQTD